MKRLIFVTLAFLVGCNGMGSGANRFLPAGPGESIDTVAAGAGAASMPALRRGPKTKVRVTMTIPKRHRRDPATREHPATISPLTQSVSIAVNGGGAHVFSATPSSAACSIGPSGTVCTFVVDAPVGSDTFVIATFSGASGGGVRLDQGSAVFNVVQGKNNTPSVRLGPVVSTTADSGVGSLRYAIGAANAGDTIMLFLPTGSTIGLTSPLTVSNRVSIAGPGVTPSARRRDARTKPAYNGISISGNNAQQMFSIQAGATMTISGLILTNGNATVAPGGAISNAGTLTLVSDVFTGNKTTIVSPLLRRALRTGHAHKHPHDDAIVRHPHCPATYIVGGAVYNNATLIVSSTTFDGNSVSSAPLSCQFGVGGAIFNDTNGTLSSSGNVYTNNSAYDGGAVYNDTSTGQALFTGDTFKANVGCTATTGCPTTGCSGTSCTNAAVGYGAAIYDGNGPGVNISGSIFENNAAGGNSPGAYGEGGALHLSEGAPSVTGSTFSGNVAGGGSSYESDGYGGAIYWNGSGNGLQLNNDTFNGNEAGGDYYGEGGAIDASEPITGSNDTFTSNTAVGSGSIQYTYSEAEGGAIYQDGGLTLSNSSFTKNVATCAYYSEGGAIFSDSSASFGNDTFTSNVATATGSTGYESEAYGGAIYNNSGPMRLSNDSFTSNTASIGGSVQNDVEGGAIYNDGTSGMSSIHDTFASNAATATAGSGTTAYGGAITSYEPLTSTFDSFTSNTATSSYEAYGGAIYSYDTSTSIANATIASNVASAGYEGYGGGIYDYDGLTMGGDAISGNSATHRGGGLYDYLGTEAIANTSFTANKVTGGGYKDGGGAIYNGDTMTLNGSTVSGNSATVSGTLAGGGGIYTDSTLTMTGSTVSGNAVLGSAPPGSGGGGIFNDDSATIVNSTISANSSNVDGGGLLNASSAYLANATVFQNKATGSGGSVSNTSGLTLANTIVAGGSASVGADISNSSTVDSEDYNIIQTAVVGTAISGTTTHNLQVNPLLLGLANNGGPTFTNADQASSPGKADIPFATSMCNGVAGTNVDQRGFARGLGGRCDVGAYEFAGVASAGIRQQPVRRRPGHHVHPKQQRRPHPQAPPRPAQ